MVASKPSHVDQQHGDDLETRQGHFQDTILVNVRARRLGLC